MSDLNEFRADPVAFLRSLHARAGDVARFRIGAHRLTLLAHPEAIRGVLVAHAASFVKGPGLLRSRPVLGQGLLTTDGPVHASDRRALLPAFVTTAVMGEYAQTMAAAIQSTLTAWRDEQEIDIHREMGALSLEVAIRCFFGGTASIDACEIGSALSTAIDAGYSRLGPSSNRPDAREANSAFAPLRAAADEGLLRGQGCGTHVLDALAQLPEARRRDHAATLLIAGHESIAIALAWAWMLIDRHPRVREKLECEAAAIDAGELDAPFPLTQRLTYARAVLAETLRLYPPAWMLSRQAIEAVEVPGAQIAAGEIVVLAPCVTQIDERWFVDPREFRPERWIDSPKPVRNAFFPFGSGPHLCIGEPFAWAEGILALSLLACRWRVSVAPDFVPAWKPLVTLRPAHAMSGRLHSINGVR
ncbi:MAG: cytochrome P450 [Capsulimonadaceae bacterium]|nr:cytochrome P450 [Capsulimonadaceae bacterium]